VIVSRRLAAFLVAAGAFPVLVWPNFLRIVATDDRAFDPGPTAYLVVHTVLGVTSMTLGALTVAVAVRAWRRAPADPRVLGGHPRLARSGTPPRRGPRGRGRAAGSGGREAGAGNADGPPPRRVTARRTSARGQTRRKMSARLTSWIALVTWMPRGRRRCS
jgi:hypothetical protein